MKRSILFSLIALTLAACSKRAERTQHEPSIQKAREREEVTAKDLTEYYERTQAAKSATDYRALVVDLEPKVLSLDTLNNPDTANSQTFRDALRYYNYSILKWIELSPDDAQIQTHLSRYYEVVGNSCSDELTGCKFIGIFSSDVNSSKILQKYLEPIGKKIEEQRKIQQDYAGELRRFYQVVGISYDLKNRQKDPSLDFQYLRFASSYARLLSEDKSSKGQEKLRNHGRLFESLLQTYPMSKNSEQFQALLEDFSPWTYSRLDKGDFPFGNKEMFAAGVKSSLYEKGTTKLSQQFQKALSQLQNKEDSTGKSFKQMVLELKLGYPFLLKGFGIDADKLLTDSFYDEYFYMVDRLFRGHLNSEEAGQVWKISSRDGAKLAAKMEDYFKLQLVATSIFTINEKKKIYSSNAADSENLLRVALQGGQHISNRWDRVVAAGQSVANFAIEQISKDTAEQDKARRIKTIMASIDRNMKYVAGFPHTMILSYFMSEREASITYQTWWGASFKITADKIINELFQGKLSSWFRYGSLSEDGISKFELNYAFYYSIISTIFEAFEGSVKSDGSPVLTFDRYFDVIVNNYLKEELERLKRANENQDGYLRYDLKYEDALRLCQFFENPSSTHTIALDGIETLMKHFATGVGISNETGILAQLNRVYSDLGYGIVHTIKSIRYEMNPKLKQLKILAEILKKNRSFVSASSLSDDTVAKIDAIFSKIEMDQKEYYERSLAAHRKISACQIKATELEIKFRYAFLKHEYDRLGLVYDAYVSSLGQGEQAFQNLSNNVSLGMIPDLEKISDQGYSYNHLNFLLRAKEWLARQSPVSVAVPMPAIGLSRHSLFGVTSLVSFKDSKNQLIKRDEFIRSALKRLNGGTDSFLSWTESFYGVSEKNEKIEAMTELMKFSSEVKSVTTVPITPAEILSEFDDLMEKTNISAADFEVLRWLSLERKITRDQLASIFPVETELFASPFSSVYSRMVKNSYVLSSEDIYLQDAKELYIFASRSWHYIFAPPKEVDELPRSYFQRLISDTEKRKEDIDKAIASWENGHTWGKKKYLYFIPEGKPQHWWMAPLDLKTGRSIMVSRERLLELQNTLSRFHEDTANYYKEAK